MATFADLFKTCYLTGGSGVEFAEVRLHYRGADQVCRAFGAMALTVGSDIFFREDAFAPHTPEGLRILAHEVAHVVQQHRGPVAALDVAGGLAVAPAGSAEEHEAEAAADALLSGRPFAFTTARSSSGMSGTWRRVVQRYMAWEHCLLGDVDSARLSPEQLEAQCVLLERPGRDPRNVDEERLRAEHPGVETLRLPGSGLVVTLGELNVLPDRPSASPATAPCWPAQTERCTHSEPPRLPGGPSRNCWPTGKPASPARRSSKAFPTTSNRRARSSPCGSGTTAACVSCASANCSACGAPPP
jgi:hypothetical protein